VRCGAFQGGSTIAMSGADQVASLARVYHGTVDAGPQSTV
jgi:hypothetical protein